MKNWALMHDCVGMRSMQLDVLENHAWMWSRYGVKELLAAFSPRSSVEAKQEKKA